MASRMPSIFDLNAELARLTMFQRSPDATAEDRAGSVAELAHYRDGLVLAIKAAGRDHWERHLTGDELVHILDARRRSRSCAMTDRRGLSPCAPGRWPSSRRARGTGFCRRRARRKWP
ncbi:MAG: hypothetical protein IT563_03105 [Alphaproteobacteria bacterium]|nr:hypothetical protein [Alphaproteobacteria bacterium]